MHDQYKQGKLRRSTTLHPLLTNVIVRHDVQGSPSWRRQGHSGGLLAAVRRSLCSQALPDVVPPRGAVKCKLLETTFMTIHTFTLSSCRQAGALWFQVVGPGSTHTLGTRPSPTVPVCPVQGEAVGGLHFHPSNPFSASSLRETTLRPASQSGQAIPSCAASTRLP